MKSSLGLLLNLFKGDKKQVLTFNKLCFTVRMNRRESFHYPVEMKAGRTRTKPARPQVSAVKKLILNVVLKYTDTSQIRLFYSLDKNDGILL